MPTVALSGNDTINIDGRVLTDLADQNPVELTYVSEIAALKTGKNGNTLYALNETGKRAKVMVRLIRGSSDDKYMNGKLVSQQQNFAGAILMQGQFIKKVGDGQGNISNDIYPVSGGIFVKQVDAKMNVEGDVDQSVSVYNMEFANAQRAIT